MTRPLPCSALLALGLIAAMPSSVTAQSLLARDPGCPLVAFPDPERFCERLDRSPAPGGVAVLAGPRGASEMVETERVIATVGLAGPTVLRARIAPAAPGGSDVEATGSVVAPGRAR
jgi:hypothetical protein